MSHQIDIRSVKPSEWLGFQCTCCGDCCRHVENAIMLERSQEGSDAL
ncbi:hypothetical protein [Anaerocolumna xylanovorans]|nr:hypothetical protein [Anaerocolumna xylanovorans]